MPINWDNGWNSPDNTIPGYTTEASIVEVFKTAADTNDSKIDGGLKKALIENSAAGVNGSFDAAEILVIKGIHDKDTHITVDYIGARWHLVCLTKADGSYRIYSASQ